MELQDYICFETTIEQPSDMHKDIHTILFH